MRMLIIIAVLLLAGRHGFGQAGSLDHSFNSTGSVQTLVGPMANGASAAAIAIQPADQKILVAGVATSPDGHSSFAVARYLSNGTLDPNFGTGGIAIISIGEDTYGATGIAVQSDGGIVLVGQFYIILSDVAYTFGTIMRLTKTGVLDNSFTGGGTFNVAGLGFSKVVLQTNDEIIVGGTTNTNELGIMRFSSSGVRDMAYGGNGIATFVTNPGDEDSFDGMAIGSDGKVVVAGMFFNGNGGMMVCRLTTGGSADPTFGTKGKMFFSVGDNDEILTGNGVVVQPDGKVLVNGSYQSPNGYYPMLVVRINKNGTLDNSFAGNGKKGIVIGGLCYAGGMRLQSDGKIISVGTAGQQSGPFSFVMVRLNATDGSLDASFGSGGTVNTVFGPGTSTANDVAIQANGRIVVTGDAEALSGTTQYTLYTTARYLSTGTGGSGTDEAISAGRAAAFDSPGMSNLRIYPNPATSMVRVDGLDENVASMLIVRDASGNIVLTGRAERRSSIDLDISSLPAAAYFLEVVTAGGTRRSLLFEKIR